MKSFFYSDYNYFRYYDPSTGRYVTSDPIGLNAGVNTYGNVGQNPAYWIDSYGLKPGNLFRNPDMALLDAADYIHGTFPDSLKPQSKGGREYSGWIFLDEELVMIQIGRRIWVGSKKQP